MPIDRRMNGSVTGRAATRTLRSAPGADGIAKAALEAFYRHGYHGTSVRDIAEGAGVTVAALYYHFPSKADVLAHVMTRAMQDSLHGVEEAMASAGADPAAQLPAMVRAHVRYHTQHQVEAFVGNTELRSLDQAARRRVVALRDTEEHLFRSVVDAGIARGRFDPPTPTDAAVRALLAMCTHVAVWYRPGPLGPDEISEQYVVLALQLLGARRGRR
jgi:AcrR family transcriptional regulator